MVVVRFRGRLTALIGAGLPVSSADYHPAWTTPATPGQDWASMTAVAMTSPWNFCRCLNASMLCDGDGDETASSTAASSASLPKSPLHHH